LIPDPAVVSDIHRLIPEGIFRFVSFTTRDLFGFQGEYPKIPGLESESFPYGRSGSWSNPLPKVWFDPFPGGPAGPFQ
jgi:hypothetical protein